MRVSRSSRLFVPLLVLSLLLIAPGLARAVEYGGIGANPANPDPSNPRTNSIFVYGVDAGAKKDDAVRVVNNSDETRTILLYAVDSQNSTGGAMACAQAVDKQTEVGSWITLTQSTVVLEGHQSEVVPFTVNVPKNASVGEHNGCMVVQDMTAKPEVSKSGVALSFRSALRIAITIKGDVFSDLQFVGLKSIRGVDTYTLKPSVKNTGNVSVDAKISVALKNLFGQTIATNGGDYPLLPKVTGDWNFEVDRPFWGGLYRATATVAYPADPTKPLGVTQSNYKTARITGSWQWIAPKPQAAAIEFAIFIITVAAVCWLIVTRRTIRSWEKFKVRKKDTLVSLAKERKVSWWKLAWANKIMPPFQLKAGKWIIVPKKR